MVTPNDFFDEVYCINLQRRQDRWYAVNSRFLRENIKVTKIIGIDGWDENIKADFKELCRVLPKNGLKTSGAYAILLTYIKLYRSILEKKQTKVLIFEDDVLFSKSFNILFNNHIEKLPEDWKVWGLAVSQLGYEQLKYTDDKMFYSPRLPNRTYGLFAHAVTNDLIETLLPKLETMLKPVDVDIYLGDTGVYVSNPLLCYHDYGYSDNTNSNVNIDIAKRPGFSHRLVDKQNYW